MKGPEKSGPFSFTAIWSSYDDFPDKPGGQQANMRNSPLSTQHYSLAACAFLLASCSTHSDPGSNIATAQLTSAEGKAAGTAYLSKSDDGLVLNVSVSGLQAGEKALHLHSVGDCTAADFKSAGGHLNPFNRAHGMHNPQGKHLGDLNNIIISDDGTGSATIPILGNSEENLAQILDMDGTAVMLHAGPDDYVSDPAGAAGPRIACGVLTAR